MTKASEPSLLLVYAMYVPQSIASTDANVDLARILTPRTLANLLRLRQECVSQSLSKGYWASAIPKDQFVPSVDLSGVVTWTDANDPGVVRIAAPTLMMQGTADVTVQPRTTDVVADKLCASGNELTYRVVPSADHEAVVQQGRAVAQAWVKDRFEAGPATSNCQALPRAAQPK